MRLGEVRVAEDSDFAQLAALADEQHSWKLAYGTKSTQVWTKDTEDQHCKMIKAKTTFADVDADVVYDVLHDSAYRRHWDKNMLEGSSAGCLNPNNEICYYAVSCPPPLKNRDLVLLRSWLDTGAEYYVLTHSVSHDLYPPRKGFVRALNYLAGFVLRPLAPHGCVLHYVAHTSPGGQLPPWLVNKVTQIMAPKMVKRLHKACVAYPGWKRRHDSHFKPWRYPEQMTSERLNLALCTKNPLEEKQTTVDDADLRESEFISTALDVEDD